MKMLLWSDLHVSAKNLKVALEVLREVKRLALEHQAVPVFCGDFWDTPNVLETPAFNAVCVELRSWVELDAVLPHPTSIWITGNHDQVDLQGTVHGMAFLREIGIGAHVYDEPGVLPNTDVLFLPYRRRKESVLAELQKFPDPKMIVCHVDVVGAMFNDSIQAGHGIDPAAFPRVSVWTGHYHKPHAVKGFPHIQYVGSQYQINFSEAGQAKRVVLVDIDKPEKARDIAIDLGPRHHVIDENTGEEPDLRPGDKVVVKLSDSVETVEHREFVAEMEAKGVSVEVRIQSKKAEVRIENADEMGVGELFAEYARQSKLPAEVVTEATDVLAVPNLWQDERRPEMGVRFTEIEVQGFGPFLERQTYPLSERGAVMICGRNFDDPGSESNGAGKTTLVMAALWCLTGKSDPRPDGNVMAGLGAELVNDNAKDALVELACEVNGKPLVVTRSMGKGGHKLGINFDGKDCSGATVDLSQQALDAILDTELVSKTVFFGQHQTRGFLEATDKAAKEQLGTVVSMAPWQAAELEASRRAKAVEGERLAVDAKVQRLQGERDQLQIDDLRAQAETWENERVVRVQTADAEHVEHQRQSTVWVAERSTRELALRTERDVAKVEVDAWEAGHALRLGDEQKRYRAALTVSQEWDAARTERIAEVQKSIDALAAAYNQDVGGLADQAMRLTSQRAGIDLGQAENTFVRLARKEAEDARTRLGRLEAERDHLGVSGKQRRETVDRRLAAMAVELDAARAATETCPTCKQAVGADAHARFIAELQDRMFKESEQLKAEVEAIRVQYRAKVAEIEQAKATVATKEEGARKVAEADLTGRQERQAEAARIDGEISKVQADIAARKATLDAEAQGLRRSVAQIQAETNPNAALLAQLEAQYKAVQAETNPHASLLAQLEAQIRAVQAEKNPHEDGVERARQRCKKILDEVCPFNALIAKAQARSEAIAGELQTLGATADELACRSSVLDRVVGCFGRTGVQNYAMEAALSDLQSRVHRYLDQLSGGYLALELSASSVSKAGKVSEKFSKKVRVRRHDGSYVERDVQQLSGGQWQRESTAMTLAFAEFCAARTGIRSNLIVLDEVFRHLDPAGRRRVASLIRDLGYETILVISHDIDLAGLFETTDLVAMHRDVSRIHLDVDPATFSGKSTEEALEALGIVVIAKSVVALAKGEAALAGGKRQRRRA